MAKTLSRLLLSFKFLESEFLEEVVTLVVNEDECREVFHMDLPDSLHSEFRVLYALDALDVVLRKDRCRTSDRAEVESAVLLASICNLLASVTLCSMIMLPPWLWKRSTYESIRPAVVGPIEPQGIPAGVFAGPA